MFKLKVYSHCHGFISNKVNEVKVNFHSPSINRWSVWTRREVLAISQAELILSGSTCHDSALGNVTECSTSPCPCWGSSDEFLVSDLWPAPPPSTALAWSARTEGDSQESSGLGSRSRSLRAWDWKQEKLLSTVQVLPSTGSIQPLQPTDLSYPVVCILLLLYACPWVVISWLGT